MWGHPAERRESNYEDPLFTKPVGYTLDRTPFGVKMYPGGS